MREGILVFAALECKAKRRRQGAVRRNYQTLVMACSNFDPDNPLVPPYEIPCPSSGYTETKTGRFRQPVSTTSWSADFQLVDNLPPTSQVRMRIDEFDGTNVRGVIFGVFTEPIQGAASTVPAQIDGEVEFNFPFRIE